MRTISTLTATLFVSALAVSDLVAKDYYVSVARGKGKKATKEKPAKDLGNIIKKLEPGDTIYIAEGVYVGRGASGHDKITVPVTILGGWSDDFSARDPWGEHQTVFSGDNLSDNFNPEPRLFITAKKHKDPSTGNIVVDGIIVDNGDRNQYRGEGDLAVKRTYTPKTGQNATPSTAGIKIEAAAGSEALVQNCVVTNTGPSGLKGAIYLSGGAGSTLKVHNNLVVNNTGTGIQCNTWFNPRDDSQYPTYEVTQNTVLFNWKYDPPATHGGNALMMDRRTKVLARRNVFGFNDRYGVNNAKNCEHLDLAENVFCSSLLADYIEFDTKMALDAIEDEADNLGDETEGNEKKDLDLNINSTWAQHYAARNVIDRAKAEASIAPLDNWQNSVRSMFGLPLDGGTLDVDSDVWCHRMALQDVLALGINAIEGTYGCQNPGNADS